MENKGSSSGSAGKSGGAAGITGSAKNAVTPGFLGGAGGGEKPDGLSDKNAQGAAVLGAAEGAATNTDLGQNSDDLNGAREDEEAAEGYYSGEGRDDGEDDNKNFLSGHKGPVATLIGLFVALAGMIGGAQLSQPFSLAEQLRTTFNTMQTSVSHRSNVLFKYQLGKDVKNPVKSKLFGRDVFKVSSKQEAKLKQRGIEIAEVDGKNVMKFTDGAGNVKYVVPDAKDIPTIKGKVGEFEVMDFNTAFKTDTEFFEAYKGGSLTWRGSIANWFESMTMRFLSDNKLTRNLFNDFEQKVDQNGKFRGASELMAKGTDELTTGGTATSKTNNSEAKTKTDADGNVTYDDKAKVSAKAKTETESGVTIARSKGSADVEAKLTAEAKKMSPDSGGGISGMVQTATSIICGAGDVIGVISLAVTGAELLQIIHLITGYLEAIDKVKAGDGDASPINEIAQGLNEVGTSTHYDLEASAVQSLEGVDGSSENSWEVMESNAGKISTSTSTTTKTAMESSGIASLYGGGKVNPGDASVKSMNFTKSIKRIVGGLGVSMAAFNTCTVAKMGANAWGLVEDAIEYIPCIVGLIAAIFTYGATSTLCAGAVFNIVSKVAMTAVISAAIGAVISAIVPFAAKMLTRDLITNLAGEDLGNALVSGSNLYMGNNHRYNGGSLANKDTYVQFAMAQQEVIAEDARYERLIKSPFDASSQHTFMGTLMRQLMNFVGSSSIMSVVSSANNTLVSSIASISPTASAIDANYMLVDNYEEECPYLASIGAVGDAYCNPYAITDMSTMGMDPSEVMAAISDNLIIEEEGSAEAVGNNGVKIKGNSQLAQYIMFCDQRASSFGIVDQNISNKLADWSDVRTESDTINMVTNGAIGGVPMYGDFVDVVQNAQKLANLGYITGESCVAGNNLEEGTTMNIDTTSMDNMEGYNGKSASIATPSWSKARLYQRFIEDQSLMESMGIVDKSAVTAFLEEYYEENPLDNSYEGILARYSGLSKEGVIAVEDAIDYYTYIANYDPTERYAFGQDIKPAGADELKFDNDQKIAYVVLLNTIEFADVRNRSFVV